MGDRGPSDATGPDCVREAGSSAFPGAEKRRRRVARALAIVFLTCCAGPSGPVLAQPAGSRTMESVLHPRGAPAPKDAGKLPPALASESTPVPETILPPVSNETVEAGLREFGSRWLGPTLSVPGAVGETAAEGAPGMIRGIWSRHGTHDIWRATIRSPGAYALRIRLSGFRVQGSVHVRPRGSTSGLAGPYFGRGPQDDGDFWTDIVHSDAVTIEYVRQATDGDLPELPPFRVPNVGHVIRPLVASVKTGGGLGGGVPPPFVPRYLAGCHLDASCYPEWEDRAQPSVALLLITGDEGQFGCTGTLIATNYESDDHLMMLTAGHCIQNRDQAVNTQFIWDFQTTECNGRTVPREEQASTTGATLVASRVDRRADFALLRLDRRAVLAVTGVLSRGWTASRAVAGTGVASVSHPNSTYKRLSFGELEDISWSNASSASFTGVSWRMGTTETGSSGAGILRESDGLLVGLLIGGSVDLHVCDRDFFAAINRFSAIYDEISVYLESEQAVSARVPVPIVISLGSSGESVTIGKASDGTFWLGDSPVRDGYVHTTRTGGQYRLRRSEGGSWSAVYVASYVRVRVLGTTSEVPVVRTEDGSHLLDGEKLREGSGLTHAVYGTYRLSLDPDEGVWNTVPVPAQVPLPAAGLSIETVAGTGLYGYGGDGHEATRGQLANPSGVAVAADGSVLIADTDNHRIRRVSPDGMLSTIAGSGTAGFEGDGAPATLARLRGPRAIAVGRQGDIYIADTGNHRIRVIGSDGTIQTLAGSSRSGFGGDGGPAEEARLSEPHGIALDREGNLYIADTGNHRIRRVSDGQITTIAGTGLFGPAGDGGPAHLAQLHRPQGIAVSTAGLVYVADTGNHVVRLIDSDGSIRRITGTGVHGLGGSGGPPPEPKLDSPHGLALGPGGLVYISDSGSDVVWRVDGTGIAQVVAGTGTAGSSDDGTPSHRAMLQGPLGLAVDEDGRLLIADSRNRRIRRLRPGWNLVPGDAMPSAELVPLGEPGDWARLWRTADGKYYRNGRQFESGDLVNGWRNEVYELEYHPVSGWVAKAAEIDFAERFETVRKLALEGHAWAQSSVGWHYLTGRGVEMDLEAALRWLQRAAAQGDADGPYLLGQIYDFGLGVEYDSAKAAEWYRQGALQGNAWAQYELGLALRDGRGVEQSPQEGFRWLLRSAMQDHPSAQQALAYTFQLGLGVPVSLREAFEWDRLAANQGNPWSQVALGTRYLDGEGVSVNLEEGLRWVRLAAERGNLWGQLELGFMYESGEGVPRSPADAAEWYRRAATQGSAYAQWRLGAQYSSGSGVEQDSIAALVWLALALRNGEDRAAADWEALRSRVTPEQLRTAAALGARCVESGYEDCP